MFVHVRMLADHNCPAMVSFKFFFMQYLNVWIFFMQYLNVWI